jgi:hypothetical protein
LENYDINLKFTYENVDIEIVKQFIVWLLYEMHDLTLVYILNIILYILPFMLLSNNLWKRPFFHTLSKAFFKINNLSKNICNVICRWHNFISWISWRSSSTIKCFWWILWQLENEGECEQNKNNGIWIWVLSFYQRDLAGFSPIIYIIFPF